MFGRKELGRREAMQIYYKDNIIAIVCMSMSMHVKLNGEMPKIMNVNFIWVKADIEELGIVVAMKGSLMMSMIMIWVGLELEESKMIEVMREMFQEVRLY